MNEKVKQALENFKCIKEDLDYFQPKDLVCTNREEQYKSIENALNDFDRYHESQQDLIKGKDEYIAKLCNDRAELKEQLKQVEDFKYHYDRYRKELANNLKVINCMQEEATTNYNLIEQLEDRNDRLVERLEKQKATITCLRIENANLLGDPFIPNDNKPKVVELYNLNENDITNLVKFAQIMAVHTKTGGGDYISIHIVCDKGEKDYPILKEVVEKYGK